MNITILQSSYQSLNDGLRNLSIWDQPNEIASWVGLAVLALLAFATLFAVSKYGKTKSIYFFAAIFVLDGAAAVGVRYLLDQSDALPATFVQAHYQECSTLTQWMGKPVQEQPSVREVQKTLVEARRDIRDITRLQKRGVIVTVQGNDVSRVDLVAMTPAQRKQLIAKYIE